MSVNRRREWTSGSPITNRTNQSHSQPPCLFPLPLTPLAASGFNSHSTSNRRVRSRSRLFHYSSVLMNYIVIALNRMFLSESVSVSLFNIPVSDVAFGSISASQGRVLNHIRNLCLHFVRYSREEGCCTVSDAKSRKAGDGPLNPCDDGFRPNDPNGSEGDDSELPVIPVHLILMNFLRNSSVTCFYRQSRALSGCLNIPFDPLSFSSCQWDRSTEVDELQTIPPSYFGDPTATAVPIIAKRVSLPSSLSRVNMLALLPDYLQKIYEKPNDSLLIPPPAQPAAISASTPSGSARSPRFSGPPTEYVKLLERMKELNMVGFTVHPKAVNGVFGVKKDDNEIRLIIDATPANALFVPCPPVALPNPSHLSRLYVPNGKRLWMAKCDLESFYHQLTLPSWLTEYFALPAVDTQVLVQAGLVKEGEFGESPLIHPMCLTLPMGWSHSVFVAHSLHEQVV